MPTFASSMTATVSPYTEHLVQRCRIVCAGRRTDTTTRSRVSRSRLLTPVASAGDAPSFIAIQVSGIDVSGALARTLLACGCSDAMAAVEPLSMRVVIVVCHKLCRTMLRTLHADYEAIQTEQKASGTSSNYPRVLLNGRACNARYEVS